MQKPQQAEERKEKPSGRGVVRAVPSGDQLVLSLDKVASLRAGTFHSLEAAARAS